MIDLDNLRAYCHRHKGVSESFPFDDDTLVFKVMGKIFALTDRHSRPIRLNLKCDPDWAVLLRATYPAVTPGYHMNKRHWNTVLLDGSISDDEIWEMIDHSYRLVAAGLKGAERATWEAL